MRLIKKVAILFIAILVILIGSLVLGYNFLQSNIESKIEEAVSESIKGEIEISDFSYSLFSTYPKLTVAITSIGLYDTNSREELKSKIAILDSIYLKVDIGNAWQNVYTIDEITIKRGLINIIGFKDSTLNILNATTLVGVSDTIEVAADESEFKLIFGRIDINNVQINYTDELTEQFISSILKQFTSKAIVEGDSLFVGLSLSYQLDSITIEKKRVVKTHQLKISSIIAANLDQSSLVVTNGSIKLDLLDANLNGTYDGANRGAVDFSIWAKHTDLSSLAKLDIFKEENFPEIKDGVLELDATIKGFTAEELPIFKATATLDSLQVYNRYGKMIDNAGFKLLFSSESVNDLMESHLKIDSISIDFTSGGYFKGRVESKHFKEPEFKINWEAKENLRNIDKLIKIPELKQMSGEVASEGSIQGIYQIRNQSVNALKGELTVSLNKAKIILEKENYIIDDIQGTIFMKDDAVGLNKFSFNSNSNKIEIDGRINNLLPYLKGEPANLIAQISIKSDSISTKSLLAFDKPLADSTDYIVRDFDVDFKAVYASKNLENYALIPTGNLTFLNFTALVDGAPPIAEFSGSIETKPNLVVIKNFRGIIGKSHVDFSVSVLNYAAYLQTETTEQMVIDVSLKSEQANAKDFFTINHAFILPKNYEEEVLKNVAVNAKVITTNAELQKTDLLPEIELQVTGLQFQTLYTPVVFKDIFIFGMAKDNNVYINSMFGKFGRSDVFMNAQFDNVIATKDTILRELKSRITFNAGVLDLNELVKLNSSTDAVVDSLATGGEPSNPFADKFPITEFQLNIGELNYYDATIRELSGLLKIEKNNYIHLHEIKLKSGEYGSFEFEGELDASSRTEAILNSTIKISDVDLSKLNVSYVQNEEEVKIKDHFEGMINGEIIANVPVLKDFSFDLARLTGKVKVKMTDGALINYAPLEEMGNYFKNKDLKRVKFDELKNTMIFNAGKILLPFMTINTSLGTINLMGYQSLDNDMEYDIQVPLKLVAGSALNSLFASKKGDDGKEDEVVKARKGKYITVHISGKDDQYKFKLGKKHTLTAPPGFKVD